MQTLININAIPDTIARTSQVDNKVDKVDGKEL